MNLREYRRLRAELSELDQLLAQVPETHIIDRISMESRKKEIVEALDASPIVIRDRAVLTFSGKPVVSGHGIFAEFGAQAINRFADAVTALAAGLSGPLGARGTIPNRENYQLLIAGTALGSFGFELEEYQPRLTVPTEAPSAMEQAIVQARRLMEATFGSDDDLADAAAETDPRAIAAVQGFLQTMADNEAACALEFRGKVFRFSDVDQVRRSAQRLSRENIREEQEWIDEDFQGVLPKRRTFEFRMSSSSEIISGKVGPTITDAGVINRVLGQPMRIQVLGTRIGKGPVRYVLIQYEEPRACRG